MIAPGISHLVGSALLIAQYVVQASEENARFAPRTLAASLRAWLEYRSMYHVVVHLIFLPTVTEVRRSLLVGQCLVKSFCAKKA